MSNSTPQRMRELGYAAVGAPDLLAVALARRESDVEALVPACRDFMRSLGGLSGLNQVSALRLAAIAGLEGFEVDRVAAFLELGRRFGAAPKVETAAGGNAEAIYRYLKFLATDTQERFFVLPINSELEIVRHVEVHRGTSDSSLVGIKEVFLPAIELQVSRIVVAHNHPSGNPTPSVEDIHITRQLIQAGRILDIEILDHVIVARDSFASMRKLGHL